MTNKSFFISLVILLVTISLVVLISQRGEPVVLETNLENLPMEIAGFKATEDFFPDSVYKELNADKHVYRHYRGDGSKKVDLYIGYYGTAKGGRTAHNPYGCLPGAGWGILDSRKVELKIQKKHEGKPVNYILAKKGDTYETSLFWYQSAGDKVLATGVEQNIQRFIGRVFYNRDDGAFVRISVFTERKGIEEANLLIKMFAENILELLPKYWPLEQ